MRNINIILFTCIIILLGNSCKKAAKYENTSYDTCVVSQDSMESIISSSCSKVDVKDTAHKFIRTAEIKFQTNDVIKTTNKIEDLAKKQGGYVQESQLENKLLYSSENEYNKDTLIDSKKYLLESNIVIRVPAENLDTTLRIIAQYVDKLDYRKIKAEDVSLNLDANKLTIAHSQSIDKNIAESSKNSKSTKPLETAMVEEMRYQSKLNENMAIISNRLLIDQVKFSTITIDLYQKETIKTDKVFNWEHVNDRYISFYQKVLNSLEMGIVIVREIILIIINLWLLLILVGLGILGYKYYNSDNQKDNKKTD